MQEAEERIWWGSCPCS